MEATNVASRRIVHEVLTKDNYGRWKSLMKNYLLGKNLWNVVESGSESTKVDDQRNNAKAMHIIQLSCGSKISDEISRFETAKDAWNYLGTVYGSEFKATADIELGVVDDNPLEHRALYEHVEKGNRRSARSYIRDKTDAIFSTSASGRTVLHIATIGGHVNIVDDLVKVGSDKLVKMQDKGGYTAVALAAHLTGNTDIAKCMVEKKGGVVREDLLAIKNEDGDIPLLLAAAKGHKEITRYLYKRTPPKELNGQDSRNRVLLLVRCIKAKIFDVALELLKSYPELPTESLSDGFRALHELAQIPSAFLSGCQFGLPQQIIYDFLRVDKKFQNSYGFASAAIVPGEGRHKTNFSDRFCTPVLNFLLRPVKLWGRVLLVIVYVFVQFFKFLNIFGIREIYEQKCTHYEVLQILRCLQSRVAEFNNSQLNQGSVYDAMLHAAKHGIVEFINAMREANHDLLWAIDGCKRGIFSYAVLYRKQNVFRLVHTLGGRKDIIQYRTDMFGNNLLHLAGHLGPSSDLKHRPGPALQMRREIQWFKAVEKVVHPECKEGRNDDGKKPHELFTETHEKLVKAGEIWAKEIARSFTLVATVITTIMFAAPFTVKEENNQETGVPIFSNTKKIFSIFIVVDAISLFTSVFSILIFLAILTLRFAEKDFQKRLPFMLQFGLVFLFVSVVSMMLAFCAAFAIVALEITYMAYWLGTGVTLLTMYGSYPIMESVFSQICTNYESLT